MPSDSKDSSSTALSLRSPGTVEEYYPLIDHTDNALVERGTLAMGLLTALPTGIGLAGIATWRGGAVNLVFGFGTLVLIFAANLWWFWYMEGFKEFIYQLEEQKANTDVAAQNLLKVKEERQRNNELHKPTLAKATFDAETAKFKVMMEKFKEKYLLKLEAKEDVAKLDDGVYAKWKAAMDATKAAVPDDELSLETDQTKKEAMNKKLKTFDNAFDPFLKKIKKLLVEEKKEKLDSFDSGREFDFSREFWESVTGETDGQSSRKLRRGSAPNDGLPRLLHETCKDDSCQRVWYSNTIQETGRKRDIAPEDIIHKIYRTPIDYDFRKTNKEKRQDGNDDNDSDDDADWEISPQDAECYGTEDGVVDGEPYHSVLELRGAGNPSDLTDLVDYIQKDPDEALHKVGEAISNGKKFKDDNGKEVTILLHKGWSCVSLTVNKKPAVWGRHGLFKPEKEDEEEEDEEDSDIWSGCAKALKIKNSK